ncbi:TMhelix containing protein [Vibrio phage vB_VpM-pA2SJ1]|uniref:TMhelix containing protein n=1 Tax=Vibrio phage vB_VpM-pA2SJ1 TaxID=3095964 RepID=A0AAX4J5Q6_9CAUD
MGLFGKLFGDSESVGKLTDGVYNGIDKAFFTDEEKKEAFIRLLKLYEPFKLAQRYMMLIVGIPFVSVHTIVAGLRVHAAYQSESFAAISDNLATALGPFNDALAIPFAVICAFYFGGGALEGFARRKASK